MPTASCRRSVEVDPAVLRAVERLLDVGHEPALRFLERLRKRIEILRVLRQLA